MPLLRTPRKAHEGPGAGDAAWWRQPLAILGHQYPGDWPKSAAPDALREWVRWKRALGFDAEHLILNPSMMEDAEGGDDPAAYRFKNRHGWRDDLLAAYLPLAHAEGLRVIVYFNCHWFRTTAFPAT
jgi:hypothetical protein